jgi:predicted DNA-binding protein YlxM (UPF0122 family)
MGTKDECEADSNRRVIIEKIEEVPEETHFELIDDSESYDMVYEIQEEKEEEEKSAICKSNTFKRRSTTLTIRQKFEILMKLEEGVSVQAVCAEYAIGRTTVYDFIKRKQSIVDYMEKCSDETRRTFKKSNYPQVERAMIGWCESRDCFTKQDFFDACKAGFQEFK